MKNRIYKVTNIDQRHKLESVFSQMNGYLGIRGYDEFGIPGSDSIPATFADKIPSSPQQFVAGYFDKSPVTGNTMVNLPTLKLIYLYLDGEKLDLSSGEISAYSRELDMGNAVTERSFVWSSPSGRKTKIRIQSFISYKRKHVHLANLTITPLNWSGKLELHDCFDCAGKTIRHQHYAVAVTGDLPNDGHFCEIRTDTSKMGASIASAYVSDSKLYSQKNLESGSRFVKIISAELKKNSEFNCMRAVSVCTDFDIDAKSTRVTARNRTILKNTLEAGWDKLLGEQNEIWASMWKQADIKIKCDDDSDFKLRFYVFQLLQAYRAGDSRLGIGAKFLTGDHYAGHYFWDTEIFIFPFYLYTFPETAKNLVQYRIGLLGGAKRKAASKKFKGAFFPWEASPIDQDENCPEWWQDEDSEKPVKIPCGSIELHINTALIYAATRYMEATQDISLASGIYCMILESARFWVSRGKWKNGKFVIENVIGPDEYHEHVDNNAYTNHTAKWNIDLALEIATNPMKSSVIGKKPSRQEISSWRKISSKMEMCVDNQEDIIAQDDKFLSLKEFDFSKSEKGLPIYKSMTMDETSKFQIVKQADVLSLFHLFPHSYSPDLMNRCWDYYEKRTVHDSNLSAGTHSIVASRLGKMDSAWKYFQKVLNLDVGLMSANLHEGLHGANTGNAWGSVIFGFAGISFNGNRIFCNPKMPDKWKSLSFNIVFNNRSLAWTITNSKILIEASSGTEISLIIEGKKVKIPPGKNKTVSVPRKPAGIIFDLDGVLVDSAICHYQAWKTIADELGIKFDHKKNDLLRGVSRRESLMIMIDGQIELPEEKIQELMHRKNEIYKKIVAESGMEILLPDVKQFLGRIKASGYRLAVGSSSKNTSGLLRQTGLDKGYFDAVADGTHISRSKPDPEVFLLAAKKMGVKPVNCLVFEDAEAGIIAAKSAGMGTVAIGKAVSGMECDIYAESIEVANIEEIYEYFSFLP